MAKRMLVGYAMRTGTTTGVVERIGEALRSCGFEVDVMEPRERPTLASYDGVVLGSAVNGGA